MKSYKIILDHPFFDARRRLERMPDRHWCMKSASLQFMFFRVQRLKVDLNRISPDI